MASTVYETEICSAEPQVAGLPWAFAGKTYMPCGRASDQIEIFCAYIPIYRKYLYILSYPVFLYYAESTKVPPRIFGPLGPKTLRGQLNT